MTIENFIMEIESCYGKYLPAMRKYVSSWLRAECKVPPEKLFGRILSTFSTRWGKPPSIVEYKEAMTSVHYEIIMADELHNRLGEMDRKLLTGGPGDK